MGILKTGKITVLTVLATVITAALLMGYTLTTVSAGNNSSHDNDDHSHQSDSNHDDHDDHDNDHDNHNDHDNDHNHGHQATPSPRPTHRPTATPIATASPTATPTDPGITVVHDGKGDGLGCAVNDCSGNTTIEGTGTGGQILGASTMADTGTFTENLYMTIMVLGATLSFLGVKNFTKASK